MKRLFIILFTVALLFSFANANESLQYVVNVDYGGAVIGTETHSSGEVFSTIQIPDLDNSAEVNDPTLPVRYLTFEVPTYVSNFKASVQSAVLQQTVSLNNAILPFEAVAADGVSQSTGDGIIYGDGYQSTADKPYAEIADEYFMNGNRHFVVLRVAPVLYHHHSKTVDFFNNISVKLEYSDCTEASMKFRPIFSKGFQEVYMISEPSIVARSPRLAQAQVASSANNILSNYIIITPESLAESIQRFADWKSQKGYSVKVETVEDILSDSRFRIGTNAKCFDKESCIREWMRELYKEEGAFYCLIVGDFHTSAPIRKFKYPGTINYKNPPVWSNPNIDEYIPTDVYFADLTTDWDFTLSSAGIYVSDVTKASMSLTIPVGRLLCWNDEQINNFTDKVITYELNPGQGDPSYLTNGFVVKHQDFFKKYGEDFPTIFSYTGKYKINTLKSNYGDIHAELRPLSSEVIAAMRIAGIYSLQDHGGPTGITYATIADTTKKWPWNRSILALEEYKNLSSGTEWDNGGGLDMLDNAGRPAIAYSWACTIAPYDDKVGNPDVVYNMASSFTVAGSYGGPAMLANTRQGWFKRSNHLEENFARHMDEFLSIGQLENISKCEYSGSMELDRFSKFTHNIIGDSELKIWKNVPTQMTGKIRTSNGTFTFAGPAATYQCGVVGQTSGYRQEISSEDGSFSLDLSSEKKLAAVYVESDKYYPQTFLVNGAEPIDFDAGKFILQNAKFNVMSRSGSGRFNIEDYSTYLNVQDSGKIHIFAFDSIEAYNGIVVGNGGSVVLECDKKVNLSGNTISEGGDISVESETLELSYGFTVMKGGTFSMVPKK